MLYGFGHIGRLLPRLLVENARAGDGLHLNAILVRNATVNTTKDGISPALGIFDVQPLGQCIQPNPELLADRLRRLVTAASIRQESWGGSL